MLAIETITIEHYRGFFEKREIKLAIPSGKIGSGLTILVGPNNSGKTTVVSALRLLFLQQQVDIEQRHEGHPLVISIQTNQNTEKAVTNPDLGAVTVLNGDINAWPTVNDFRLVPSRRAWSPYTNSQTMDTASYWARAFQFSGEDNFLISRVALLTAVERDAFDKLLKELIPQINKWRVELSRGQTFILYETHAGAKHAADLFGDGMASLFRVALALMDSRDGYIVVIDEPELSLHPQAQKMLASMLARFARDRQILITTHSPYLVRWSDLASGAKVYRLSQESQNVSIGSLSNGTLANLEKLLADWQKPNILDAVSREVFFADEVLFLEGQEDVGLLHTECERRGLPSLPAFGYGAGGAGNLKHFLRMAKDLNIPAAAIFDGDHANEKSEAEKEFPNSLLELLPTDDSRLMGLDEEGTLARLKAIRKALVDPTIAAHRGRIVKTTGDGMLVEFASAVDAARCATEVQRSMAGENADVPQEKRIEFRIGIHVGDIIIDENDIFGDGVNIAARLEGIADPGGVCVSDDAYRQVRGKVDTGFDDLGVQTLKNIAEPMRVWRMKLSSTAAPMPRTDATSQSPALALPDKPSIAVLPFQNMSGDPEQEYFADGMVEDIITALSRFKSLFVIARNSSFTYKGKAVDIKQVGRELGVRYVLEGSVRKAGGRVRITGQLIEAATGAHLWADKFDGALVDIFDLQDQVTTNVVGAIAPKLELAEIERVKRKPTVSLDSYDYYLRGMAFFYTGKHEAAAECFQQAIQRNEDYADAYAMAAGCLVMKQGQQGVPLDVEERVKAVQLAQRALSLGKDDALTLARAAHALVYLGQEYERGSAMIEQAVALNPNLSAVWFARGWISVICCDGERAIESFSQVLRLSPVDPRRGDSLNGLSWAHFLLGQYDEGCSWATKAMQNTANVIYLAAFVVNAALAGRSLEARAAAKRLLEIEPAFRASHANTAFHIRQPDVQAKIIHALRQGGVSD